MATNKYPGNCRKCGNRVQANHGRLVGSPGSWGVECNACGTPASKPTAARKEPTVSVPEGRNRRADYCLYCGEHVKVGAGHFLDAEMEEDRDNFDTARAIESRGGRYAVVCANDEAGCKTRQTERRAAAKVAAKAAAEAAAARKVLEATTEAEVQAKIAAHLTGQDCVTTEYPLRGTLVNPMEREVVQDAKIHGQTVRVTFYVLADGRHAMTRETYSYDDDRCSYTAPRDLVESVLSAAITASIAEGKTHYTPDEARAWLVKYEGCVGTDINRLACGLDPWSAGYLVRESESA
jgi:hypothetical protein